jgi:endonuclease YncB( thermonuclease family)
VLHFRPSVGVMMGRGGGVLAVSLAVGGVAIGGCFGAAGQEPQQRNFPCGGDIIARVAVSRFIDGRSFVLADGREVRLAAIEVAAAPQKGLARGGDAAKAALAGLIGDNEVVLRQAEPQKFDRYGRIVAYAFTVQNGAERPVQAALIAAGFARAGARIGNRACALELLTRERDARRAKLGLWASSYYDSLDADDPAGVLAEQGHFALVEGKVVSVRESGATIYVNFGRRWSEDFTVTISKRNARNFTAAGLEPMKLAGRRVRVRGFIEPHGGPWMEASRPEQIELVDREQGHN